mmetsp:Transcript_22210/g.49149  ORF Transcript_22210/g.49149 Transcript_22210/m.49149 type:complete len:300 (+) Transcript_22210:324-1223(+)
MSASCVCSALLESSLTATAGRLPGPAGRPALAPSGWPRPAGEPGEETSARDCSSSSSCSLTFFACSLTTPRRAVRALPWPSSRRRASATEERTLAASASSSAHLSSSSALRSSAASSESLSWQDCSEASCKEERSAATSPSACTARLFSVLSSIRSRAQSRRSLSAASSCAGHSCSSRALSSRRRASRSRRPSQTSVIRAVPSARATSASAVAPVARSAHARRRRCSAACSTRMARSSELSIDTRAASSSKHARVLLSSSASLCRSDDRALASAAGSACWPESPCGSAAASAVTDTGLT